MWSTLMNWKEALVSFTIKKKAWIALFLCICRALCQQYSLDLWVIIFNRWLVVWCYEYVLLFCCMVCSVLTKVHVFCRVFIGKEWDSLHSMLCSIQWGAGGFCARIHRWFDVPEPEGLSCGRMVEMTIFIKARFLGACPARSSGSVGIWLWRPRTRHLLGLPGETVRAEQQKLAPSYVDSASHCDACSVRN